MKRVNIDTIDLKCAISIAIDENGLYHTPFSFKKLEI